MRPVSLFVLFVLSHLGTIHLAQEERNPTNEDCQHHPMPCGNLTNGCQPKPCGKLGTIKFPFRLQDDIPHCGLLAVNGCLGDTQMIQLKKNGGWSVVENISKADSVFIREETFGQHLKNRSCETFTDLGFIRSPSLSIQINPNLTVLKCDPGVYTPPSPNFTYTGCSNFTVFYNPELKELPQYPKCELLQLPATGDPTPSPNEDVFSLLTANFTVDVVVSHDCEECHENGRDCLSGEKEEFQCSKKGNHNRSGIILAVAASVVVAMGVAMITLWYIGRRVSFTNNKTQVDRSIDAFLKDHGPLMQKRYNYSEIKKMTESFGVKLGQGGYGSVFKGKLPDGRLVAVKVLKESNTRSEDFINEVASISRTSHVNIVTLLGYCFEGSKRALIYEFMSNGSLDKYTHQYLSQVNRQLGYEALHQIALGIARGLEYLHRGCNTRILHFDIKPHNILLDENFFPKISDFGLAKICLQKESIVSMSGARGTAGYIAPEVFCRNFGGVSHKSDVYSYGMMVLEMVMEKKNVLAEVDNTSEMYFPDWIYKHLEQGSKLGIYAMTSKDENQLARRMIIVSLWCIQTKPSHRPHMSRVIEMLQGSFQPLDIPPRPYLFSASLSPQRSDVISSTEYSAL